MEAQKMDIILTSVEICSRLIAGSEMTIAFAESATAGSLTAAFSHTEYSGKILKGGIVCYDADLKTKILDVSKETIEKYTPESIHVTRQMARHLKKLIDADIYVAITGLIKPGGSETAEKPVGTMFICIRIAGTEINDRSVFAGDEEDIVAGTVQRLSNLLIAQLAGTE